MEPNYGFFTLFLAGGMAGASIDLVLQPLDYVKTRQHTGMALDINPRSVYKGLSATLAASFPCAATFWGFYMGSKQIMLEKGFQRVYAEPVSALIGSFTCCIIRNPFERVKQLMQIGEKVSARLAIQEVISKTGVNGLYKGFTALCTRELPFDTIQMLIFQSLSYANFCNLGQFGSFFYGGIAGAITAMITCPIDVVKTKMMTSHSEFHNLYETAKNLHKIGGFKAFWRGWQARVAYITIGGMMYFGVFNNSLKFLIKNDE